LTSYLQDTFFSLPIPYHGYYYYARTIEGKSHALHCRAPVMMDPSSSGEQEEDYVATHLKLWDGTPEMALLPGEHVYLDENELAKGHDHFEIGNLDTIDDWVAYTVDTTGYEHFELIVQNMDETQEILIRGSRFGLDSISPSVVWGADHHTLFLMTYDATSRPFQVLQCTIQDDGDDDGNAIECEMIFEEPDVQFWVSIRKTLDEHYLLVQTRSPETDEVLALDLTASDATLISIAPRTPGVKYGIDHGNGFWWILSNLYTPDFNLMFARVGTQDWELVLETILDDNPLSSLMVLDGHIVIAGREMPFGLPQIWIAKLDDIVKENIISIVPLLNNPGRTTDDAAPTHTAEVLTSGTGAFETLSIFVVYQSLTAPQQYLRVNLDAPDEFKLPNDGIYRVHPFCFKSQWLGMMKTCMTLNEFWYGLDQTTRE
jgi:oligopeptidase B